VESFKEILLVQKNTTSIFIYLMPVSTMIKTTHLCTSCAEIMTNPICPSCFSRQVVVWLRDKQKTGILSDKQMKKIKEELIKVIYESEETPADISCIVCDSVAVNLCTYCFMEKAKFILEMNTMNKNMLEEFNDDFNSELWRRVF
jgi:uncharacterized protein YejL (UPF0352 family)